MRAVVLGPKGEPALAEVPEPDGPGELVRVLACGLCGSDVEKLGDPSYAGIVLGHEVVAETPDGHRVALVHHAACGECGQCAAGHESLCDAFAEPTIHPGGFAERVRAAGWVELPAAIEPALGTMVEPLACVLRGARLVEHGRVLVVGNGFVGRLFTAVLERRGAVVFAVDLDPRRDGRRPDGPVDTVVVTAPGGVMTALDWIRPGGDVLVFADGGDIPSDVVYRHELTVRGVRSASPETMHEAVELLPTLDLPTPVTLPLESFDEGLERYRRREALKVVFVPA